jgi:predicted nucleic acid-binding protein
VSLYIDTSAFLKLIFAEPESPRASELIRRESDVTVSSLARLEALVQIQRHATAGLITPAKARERRAMLQSLLATAPFQFKVCPSTLTEIAEKQIASPTTYCPTLDRLHLAAMEHFGLNRLLTNDDTQAAAARALGFHVIMPR